MDRNLIKGVRNTEKRSISTARQRVEGTGKNNPFSYSTLNQLNNFIYKENKENYKTIKNKNKVDNVFKINTKEFNPTEENLHPVKHYDVFRIFEGNKISSTRPKIVNNIENENRKLKEEISKLNEQIKSCIKKLEEALEKLKQKEKLITDNKNKIYELEKSFQEKEDSLNKCLKENNILKNDIEKLKAYSPFELSEGEKILSIVLLSSDQNICYPVICKNTDLFAKIENLIFDEYPEYKCSKNNFFINGNKVNKNGSLEQNNIKDKSIIFFQANDND